jgi:hypothetical protein
MMFCYAVLRYQTYCTAPLVSRVRLHLDCLIVLYILYIRMGGVRLACMNTGSLFQPPDLPRLHPALRKDVYELDERTITFCRARSEDMTLLSTLLLVPGP